MTIVVISALRVKINKPGHSMHFLPDCTSHDVHQAKTQASSLFAEDTLDLLLVLATHRVACKD